MILLENISKTYQDTPAVYSINLKIQRGNTTVLIGPSGSGKSTILRLIIGLIDPDSGKLYINNEELTPFNIAAVRKNMGYVIQDGGLFPHLTAKWNVSIMADYLGWDRERIDRRINELCELTKFPVDALSRYPSQISGGQKQRVSLMRALMLDPDVLLLDEPLGALDPLIRSDLQTDLKEIFSGLEKTVVMVTHDINEAAYLGDKIVLLSDGKIIQEGSVKELLTSPSEQFVTSFINAQRSYLDTM